ncbi:MAG TPA: hypothetical protein VL361_11885 [Candidatus Limnocylindrales bacterium]|nr:hypothetical protein [Candidatus Limnocylindrales bacterium]
MVVTLRLHCTSEIPVHALVLVGAVNVTNRLPTSTPMGWFSQLGEVAGEAKGQKGHKGRKGI